jgi:hypothetical protein
MSDDYYPDSTPLADIAEVWQRANGREVPPRGTPEWQAMYEAWIDYAFADFREEV